MQTGTKPSNHPYETRLPDSTFPDDIVAEASDVCPGIKQGFVIAKLEWVEAGGGIYFKGLWERIRDRHINDRFPVKKPPDHLRHKKGTPSLPDGR